MVLAIQRVAAAGLIVGAFMAGGVRVPVAVLAWTLAMAVPLAACVVLVALAVAMNRPATEPAPCWEATVWRPSAARPSTRDLWELNALLHEVPGAAVHGQFWEQARDNAFDAQDRATLVTWLRFRWGLNRPA